MNTLEARIVLLEAALRQAQHTVDFLHNCLVNPVDENKKGKGGCLGWSYEYPEQTIERLEEWAKLCPLGPTCFHSMYVPDCEPCQMRLTEARQLHEAKQVLGIYE